MSLAEVRSVADAVDLALERGGGDQPAAEIA